MPKPLFTGHEWDTDLVEKLWEVIDKIGKKDLGLDYHPPQFDIVTAEQMLDAYSSVGMPLYYNHWSFGKEYLRNLKDYQKGRMGLAYEMVINSNPCLAYLMEDNTATTTALVISHANCVSGDTEYLSPTGWKRIDQYDGGLVGQYDINDNLTFIKPERYIKTTTNKFYELLARGISQKVTPEHKMVYLNETGLFRFTTADEFNEKHNSKTRGHNGKFITCFNYNGAGLNLSDLEIRLAVAIKADGSFHKKISSGHFNCVNHQRVRFHLKKERKIQRLENLLTEMGVEYNKKPTYDGRYSITFNVPEGKYTKYYDSEWYNCSAHQLAIISHEVLYWDGSLRCQSFSTIYKSDADFIQFVWASCGFGTSISLNTSKEKVCYSVKRGCYSYRSISKSRGGKKNEIKIREGGESYCFTVDSGMWVARRDNCIFVTGNCGHSHFFKNNYLFQQHTNPDTILDFLEYAKRFIMQCEEQYGMDVVEQFLDIVHSISKFGVDKYPKKLDKSAEEYSNRERVRRENELKLYNHELDKLPVHRESKLRSFTKFYMQMLEDSSESAGYISMNEENFLRFINNHSLILDDWQREIIKIVMRIEQYFYPQGQTKVMNEGFACVIHYYIMTELYNQGYINEGSYLEFINLHTSVCYQPGLSHLNPYALGFEMFMDIKRACENPDEEDYKWLKTAAGKRDWRAEWRNIVKYYKDESFILQFLSPKVIRKLKLFSYMDDSDSPYYEITGIQKDEHVENIKKVLCEQLELDNRKPDLEIIGLDRLENRIDIEYKPYKNRELKNRGELKDILQYLTGYSRVTIEEE